MFTGLITDIGEVRTIANGRITIACGYDLNTEDIGASIACDGCCLTVTETGEGPEGFVSHFRVDVSNETLSCTTLGNWKQGHRVNLERALTPTSELGGHIVTGHVDGVARIIDRSEDGTSIRLTVEAPEDLAQFIAPKGSIALNGVSLTVNEVDSNRFGCNLIPHTLEATTWKHLGVSDEINLEVDLLARYVARISEAGK